MFTMYMYAYTLYTLGDFVSYARTNYSKFVGRLREPVVWNFIPIVIIDLTTLHGFKNAGWSFFTM